MQTAMGSWGPGIFGDDEAADARGDWRDAVMRGEDLEAAADHILRGIVAAEPGPRQDPYAANVWIALAVAQFETGRLSERVRDRALEFLTHGGDLARWEGRDADRGRVLDRWEAKLRGPQPAPKRIRPKRSYAVRFERGDVVRLRDPESAAEGLVFVAALNEDGTWPQVELLAWAGGEVPDAATIGALPGVPEGDHPTSLLRPKIYTAHRDQAFGPHLGEVVARGVERPPLPREMRGTSTTWPQLARSLGEPRYRDGLALALHPERLSELVRERRRTDALSRIDFFDRSVFEYECGKPLLEPRNLVKWVTYTRDSLYEYLLPGERDEFERVVERIRALGVDVA
jgi:hypothetical protein